MNRILLRDVGRYFLNALTDKENYYFMIRIDKIIFDMKFKLPILGLGPRHNRLSERGLRRRSPISICVLRPENKEIR